MTFLGTFDVGPICLSLFEVGLYYLWFSFTALLRCTLASGVNSVQVFFLLPFSYLVTHLQLLTKNMVSVETQAVHCC